jgi:hypothetical protein
MHRLDDKRMREVQFQRARFGRYLGATSMPTGNGSVTWSPRPVGISLIESIRQLAPGVQTCSPKKPATKITTTITPMM